MNKNREKSGNDLLCDVLIIGSGAGALCAALTAAHSGLDVIVMEKEPIFGGASARSGGGLWIPGNSLGKVAGFADSRAEMMAYIKHQAGPLFDEGKTSAFLDNGPAMVDFITEQTQIRFALLKGVSDYHPHHPGGKSESRSIMAKSLKANILGRDLKRLRQPLKAATFLGMQIGIEDFYHYNMALRRLPSFLYVARQIARRAVDAVFHGRSMRLTSGNALVAGLAARTTELGVRLITSAPVCSLQQDGGRVTGALADIAGRQIKVHARRGVILATGGFPHDGARRAALFPQGATHSETWGLMPYGNNGDGLKMGEGVGGYVEQHMRSAVALAPISRIDSAEGAVSCFPIFATRGNPGKIAVRADGLRFVSEASSYHDFCVGLLSACKDGQPAVAWIISDHRSLRRYGLGAAHPGLPIGSHIRSGYLVRGRTVRELAGKVSIDADALEKTVAAFNHHARQGGDPEFHRGSNAYDIWAGDPSHRPCPCLGPVEQAPFYALRVFAGSVGTFAGLQTNGKAQVVNDARKPISGLYAIGNDAASITGGDYIGAGCTIGPAMTFGYIAARHMSGLPD